MLAMAFATVTASEAADFMARDYFKYLDNAGVRPERKSVISLSGKVNFMLWDKGALKKLKEAGWPKDFSAVVD